MTPQDQFRSHGLTSSYHFKDEMFGCLKTARSEKQKALAVFDQNPEFHDEFRGIAKDFLWSLSSERAI